MAEGPLGFPRLTSIGPFVKEAKQPKELLRDIALRGHSYRNYDPEEFLLLSNAGINKGTLRTELDVIEDGRFNEMLNEAYNFWIPLDPDEKEMFAERNPDLLDWLEVYATLEEVRRPSEDL